ncbi:hypothetical protein [Streptomyces microflavus]|uniref:hypothetical protein n=1 Tax=Streptomyces microflavus TaxID=1919 RepID=UPI00381B0E68
MTRKTAEALTRVGTVAAIKLIARAITEADDNRADWLQAGVHDALMGPGGAPEAAESCAKLAEDPEEAVRQGAGVVAVWADDSRC